ncbi:MAG: hypothetical protein WC728_00910 [Elusimicrobiota bacterium]
MANEVVRRIPPKQRTRPLGGNDLELYAQTAARLVLAARLNKWYPDPFACSDRLRMLSPSLRGTAYEGVQLDLVSGLPTLKDIMSVQADRQIAEEFVRDVEARLRAGRAPTPRVAAKLAYYRNLLKVSFPPMAQIDVRLRRVLPEQGAASFQVVFDRFDTADGVFVRYTLLLDQTDSAWGDRLLERSGDYTQQTAAFRELLEKYAQDESEIMFLLMGKMEGVRVTEVTRGRIGPLWSPWAPAPPDWFQGGSVFVLHCPLDSASIGFQEDMDQDPFASLFKDFLSAESRPLVEEAGARLGYKVHKERKFTCTTDAVDVLRRKLQEAGTRNVVYCA